MGIIQKQKDLYICFVDFKKAFDTVKNDLLVETLRRFGVDSAHIRIMKKLYRKQRAVVRLDNETSGRVNIEMGVRQRYVLSLNIFSSCTQLVMNELAELDGIKIEGQNVNNIRYADDIVLLADTEEKL